MAADRGNQAGSPSGRIRGHAQSSSRDCFHRRCCSGNAAGARPCAPTARTPISRVIDCWVQISRYETHQRRQAYTSSLGLAAQLLRARYERRARPESSPRIHRQPPRRGARPCARRAAWVRRPNGHDARIQVRFAETPQPPPAWLRLWSDSPARMAADRRNQAGSPSGRIRGHAQSSSWDCFHRRRCSGNAAGARPCAPTARTPISRVIDCWVQISRYETH